MHAEGGDHPKRSPSKDDSALAVPHGEKTAEGLVICRYGELELYISYDKEERQQISTVLLKVPKAQ